jgi:hypothetical protein
MDYYNSIVMHPLLVDTINQFGDDPQWSGLKRRIFERAARYAAVQERQISPIGTYPVVGRSITYRFGVFHALAQSVLLGYLPKKINPAQVRCALTAVIRRQTGAPGTFDANGWLNIGVCGHQPALAEGYISTGSEYMCPPRIRSGVGPMRNGPRCRHGAARTSVSIRQSQRESLPGRPDMPSWMGPMLRRGVANHRGSRIKAQTS